MAIIRDVVILKPLVGSAEHYRKAAEASTSERECAEAGHKLVSVQSTQSGAIAIEPPPPSGIERVFDFIRYEVPEWPEMALHRHRLDHAERRRNFIPIVRTALERGLPVRATYHRVDKKLDDL